MSNLATTISSATQTFDDYGDATASCPIIAKSGTTFTLSISGDDVTINDLCLSGNQSSAIVSTVADRVIFNRVKVYDNGTTNGIGIRFNNLATDGQVNDSTVYGMTDDGIGISATATGTFTISNLTCYGIDTAVANGDCIQLYDSASANLVVTGGSYTKETAAKQAIRAFTSGSVKISNVTINVAGNSAQGISMEGTGTFDLSSSYIYGVSTGAPRVFTHTSGLTTIRGNLIVGGDYGIWSSHATGTLNADNNTIHNQVIASVYHTTDGAGGTLNAFNNYIDAPTNIYDAGASSTTIANYNNYGPALGAFRNDGTAYATLALWQAASTQDANSAAGVTPRFVGGASPTAKEGFRLTSDSALRRVGKDLNIGNYQDCENRAFLHPPSIGGCEATSRDAATARTAR